MGLPRPIFFLGAGASKTGNLPLAKDICNTILERFKDNPFINELSIEQKIYANLMECLLPNQRDQLIKDYVDNAKINVTHLYLANLFKYDYVDYILTVNFDNLILRALALYNVHPPTYDMAILKDLTTSTFREKSIIFLHGQSHGLWLLNTPSEMSRVKNVIPRIFDSIKNKRPWIFIGYSGGDAIFDHITNLGRFDNGIYWVTYNEEPNTNVQRFISNPTTNGFSITNMDSDTFMLSLNNELNLPQPTILEKPFTNLLESLQQVVDIEDKEQFTGVKQRVEISVNQIKRAIIQNENELESIQNGNPPIDNIKKAILNIISSQNFNSKKINKIEELSIQFEDTSVKHLLSTLFSNWGVYLASEGLTSSNIQAKNYYQLSFEKFEKSIKLNKNNFIAYFGLATYLGKLAAISTSGIALNYYQKAFKNYQKTIEINHLYHQAYHNWGTHLGYFANIQKSELDAQRLLLQGIQKQEIAIQLITQENNSYYRQQYFASISKNLGSLGFLLKGEVAIQNFNRAIAYIKKAVDINPNDYDLNFNWGTYLAKIGDTKESLQAKEYYLQALDKFEIALKIEPNHEEQYKLYYNYGTVLFELALISTGHEMEQFTDQALDKLKDSIANKRSYCYRLALCYFLKKDLKSAYKYLKRSLSNKEVTLEDIKKEKIITSYMTDEVLREILKTN